MSPQLDRYLRLVTRRVGRRPRTLRERAIDRERVFEAGVQAKLRRRWLHPFGDALVS